MGIDRRINWKLQQGRLIILLAMLLAIEILLRLMGYTSGDLKPNWLNFKPVAELSETHPFYVNDKGILVTNPRDIGIENIYINRYGFRTKEFDSISPEKTKILLLGDSFTWGMSALPLDNSFADILSRETKYEIINTGIPGTDPYQYEGIANWLIPELKPEIVLVFFFPGNDIIKKTRKLIPAEPLYFYTNAGAIDAEIDGHKFLSAKEAYSYIMNEKYYLGDPKNIFEWVVSKSALLSRIYSIRFRIEEKLEYENRLDNLDLTISVLKRIEKTALENNSKMFFVLIPEVKEADMGKEKYYNKYKNLISSGPIAYLWRIPEFEKDWFKPYPDAHLNNKGHREYADFVMRLLKEL